jgi:hypothetical protein
MKNALHICIFPTCDILSPGLESRFHSVEMYTTRFLCALWTKINKTFRLLTNIFQELTHNLSSQVF